MLQIVAQSYVGCFKNERATWWTLFENLTLRSWNRKLEKRHKKIYFVSSSKTKHSWAQTSSSIALKLLYPNMKTAQSDRGTNPRFSALFTKWGCWYVSRTRSFYTFSTSSIWVTQDCTHKTRSNDSASISLQVEQRSQLSPWLNRSRSPVLETWEQGSSILYKIKDNTHTLQSQTQVLTPIYIRILVIRHVSLRSVVPVVRWLLDASVVRTCRTLSEVGQNNQSASRLLLLIITQCDWVFFSKEQAFCAHSWQSGPSVPHPSAGRPSRSLIRPASRCDVIKLTWTFRNK